MKHGITGYTDYRCRCDVCRSAMNQYCTERRRRMGVKARVLAACGTPAAYQRGCRCDKCCNAMRQNSMKRRRAQGILPKPPSRHGTSSKYVHGCRCDECREAYTAYRRRWRVEKRANHDRSQDNNT